MFKDVYKLIDIVAYRYSMINAFRVLLNFCNGKKMNLHIDRYNKESSLNKINQCTQPCNDELKEISEITELMR